jgi:serine/threonine protein kinase
MGVVYRAVGPVLERRVAIKSLHPQMLAGVEPETAREYRLRFLQEARAAAALSPPGATTLYRIGEEEGTSYIAMEWLEGKTLEKVIQEEGKLTPPLPALEPGRPPIFFRERDRAAKWKYLVEWLADVRRVLLHHDLPRTGATTDFFDLATCGEDGRALHLARR